MNINKNDLFHNQIKKSINYENDLSNIKIKNEY